MAREPVWTQRIRNWDKLDAVITPQDVSRLLRISLETVFKHLRSGEISGAKIGNKWYIDKEKLRKKVEGETQ